MYKYFAISIYVLSGTNTLTLNSVSLCEVFTENGVQNWGGGGGGGTE